MKIYPNFLQSIFPIHRWMKLMIGATLIVSVATTPAQGCCFAWLIYCCTPLTPDSMYATRPRTCGTDVADLIFLGYLPGFRERFNDEALRDHAAHCNGFNLGIASQGRCASCGELERRVRMGPAADDVPVNNEPIRNLRRMIPDSALLVVMPTASSNNAFVEEYQRKKQVGITTPIHDETASFDNPLVAAYQKSLGGRGNQIHGEDDENL